MTNLDRQKRSVMPVCYPTKHGLKSFNFYLIEDEGKLSLIDAGINTDKCFDFLNQSMNECGYAMTDLSEIIITHNHEDHVGLVNRITDLHDVPVYAPLKSIHRLKRNQEFFQMRIGFYEQMYKEMGCGDYGKGQIEKLKQAFLRNQDKNIQADIIPLEGSDVINSLDVIETPGHSPDHLIFHDRQRKQLFSGDFLIKHISSNALVEPDEDGNRLKTVLQQEQSLLACKELDVEVAYPGHGDIIEEYQDLVEQRIHGIQAKAGRFLNYVEQGMTTANDIAKACYKNKYEKEFPLVMSEVIGHLDYLEEHNKVQKERKNGVWHYEAC